MRHILCYSWRNQRHPHTKELGRLVVVNPKPYKLKLDLGHISTTSVVVTQEQFDEIMDKFESAWAGDDRFVPSEFQLCRDAGSIPMITRGSKTQPVFEILEVETDNMSLIVRGKGPEILRGFGIDPKLMDEEER
jgi:hypothetical protein